MPTKNSLNVRELGGNDIWYKLTAGSWTDFSFINKGYLIMDAPEVNKIPLAGGVQVQAQGLRPVGIEFEIAQTGKTEIALIETLNGKSAEIYCYDGIVGDNHLEFYWKKGVINLQMSKKDGDSPQVIKGTVTFERQSSALSTADTDLPSIKKAAAGTVTGNNYYTMFSTAVS